MYKRGQCDKSIAGVKPQHKTKRLENISINQCSHDQKSNKDTNTWEVAEAAAVEMVSNTHSLLGMDYFILPRGVQSSNVQYSAVYSSSHRLNMIKPL